MPYEILGEMLDCEMLDAVNVCTPTANTSAWSRAQAAT